jgi:hypothetical protein
MKPEGCAHGTPKEVEARKRPKETSSSTISQVFPQILGVRMAVFLDLGAYGKETWRMSENKVVHHNGHYRKLLPSQVPDRALTSSQSFLLFSAFFHTRSRQCIQEGKLEYRSSSRGDVCLNRTAISLDFRRPSADKSFALKRVCRFISRLMLGHRFGCFPAPSGTRPGV